MATPKGAVAKGNGKASLFKVQAPTKTLTFEDTRWPEVEVVVRLSMSLEQFLEMQGLMANNDWGPVLITFGDRCLVSWNLADVDGNPYPATGKGMAQVPDIVLAMEIINKALLAITEVPAPLGQPSGDGSTSAQPLIELAAASRSPGNSNKQS